MKKLLSHFYGNSLTVKCDQNSLHYRTIEISLTDRGLIPVYAFMSFEPSEIEWVTDCIIEYLLPPQLDEEPLDYASCQTEGPIKDFYDKFHKKVKPYLPTCFNNSLAEMLCDDDSDGFSGLKLTMPTETLEAFIKLLPNVGKHQEVVFNATKNTFFRKILVPLLQRAKKYPSIDVLKPFFKKYPLTESDLINQYPTLKAQGRQVACYQIPGSSDVLVVYPQSFPLEEYKRISDQIGAELTPQIKHIAMHDSCQSAVVEGGRDLVIHINDIFAGRLSPKELTKRCMTTTEQLLVLCAKMIQKEIIHPDLCPGNIILTDEGSCKIIDLEGVKVGEKTFGSSKLGTPPYVAPERMRNLSHNTYQSMTYSFGVMGYMLLAQELDFNKLGQLSFKSYDDIEAAMTQHLDTLDDCDKPKFENLWNLVRGCLSLTPEHRPTADQILEQLGQGASSDQIG